MTTTTPTYQTTTDYTGVWVHVTRTSSRGPQFREQFASRREVPVALKRYIKGAFVVDGVRYQGKK